MFDEKFFDDLDERVRFFVAQSGDEVNAGAVIIRTRWGAFHTMQVRPSDGFVSLVVYAGQKAQDENGAEDAALKQEAQTKAPTLGQIFVPYAEIVSVEMFPGKSESAYLGGGQGDNDATMGFR